MLERSFRVKGSLPEPYQVLFDSRDDGKLNAYCNCAAADSGMHCKHRINILSGVTIGIKSKNLADVQVVQSWLPGTAVEKALESICELEAKLEITKRQLANAKKDLAKSFLE